MQVSFHSSSSSSNAPNIIILPYLQQPSARWDISVCNYSITVTGAVRHAACIIYMLVGRSEIFVDDVGSFDSEHCVY
jgi:hypothetical protein